MVGRGGKDGRAGAGAWPQGTALLLEVSLQRGGGDNGSATPPLRPSSSTYDSLVVGHLKFRSLFQWFKAREDVENELKVSEQDLSLEDPQLSAVRRAITGMLPGFSGLRIQRDPLHMVIRKGDATLVIDQLSDGEKLLLALTADLARRLAMACADHGDPLQGEAIVFIDEIELHLHPAWQRRVLAALRSTFPNCQFIVTTHSPQVLSEVPNDAVVLVKDFQFFRPAAPTEGRDTNSTLHCNSAGRLCSTDPRLQKDIDEHLGLNHRILVADRKARFDRDVNRLRAKYPTAQIPLSAIRRSIAEVETPTEGKLPEFACILRLWARKRYGSQAP